MAGVTSPFRVEHQPGAATVNSYRIHAHHDDAVVIELDLATKYPGAAPSLDEDGVPELMLTTDQPDTAPTVLRFPDHAGFLLLAWPGRYSVQVVLYRPGPGPSIDMAG